MQRKRSLLLALGLLLLGSACHKKDVIPSLPRTQIYLRFVPRVELVELVIKDHARAEKVRALYIEIEHIFLEQAQHAAKDLKQLNPKAKSQVSDEQLRQLFDVLRSGEKKAYKRYIEVQMELRKILTPEEFARLNRAR